MEPGSPQSRHDISHPVRGERAIAAAMKAFPQKIGATRITAKGSPT
jgi:hypothetical protein